MVGLGLRLLTEKGWLGLPGHWLRPKRRWSCRGLSFALHLLTLCPFAFGLVLLVF